ncbi:MerR family transcriptional regulator [Streptomyces sp. TR06-5]|uniref:MerR family transcriptional regulator n=1 Tax=Streptomyces sp. TR06-5 TaxID=3385976 RepID=UPI0039A18BA0
MEWPIQDVARSAGVSSRTLRHYDDIGLLPPSRIGPGGLRHYDDAALVRLQRILLLRELGLGLASIADVLAGQRDTEAALRTHLRLLEQERERLDRLVRSVRTTLRKTEGGDPLMPDEVLDGFDHTQYEDEVVERWGREAYARGDRWWRGLSDEEKRDFGRRQAAVSQDFARAHRDGLPADGEEAQAITGRHYAWVTAGWQGRSPDAEQFAGLGRMYVGDPRFAAHYDVHGEGTAAYVCEAMEAYAERNL